ncbi:LPXTG cell wall anchor domain-containing protein [Bacillus sp. JCM 19034]
MPDTATNTANLAHIGVVLFLIGFLLMAVRRKKLA